MTRFADDEGFLFLTGRLKNLIISSVLGVFTLLASVRLLGLTAAPVSSMITEGTLMAMSIISLLKIKNRRLE